MNVLRDIEVTYMNGKLLAGILAGAVAIGGAFYFITERTPDNHYDVIVVGGEPEGVAAAVSAARNGAEVLLVEERDGLGGLMTYGMLNYLDIPENYNKDVVSQGIFTEWWQMVGGPEVTTIDIDDAKEAFLQLVEQEENIDLRLETEITDVLVEGKEISGIKLSDEETYTATHFIDTTVDGDLAADAGVSYTVGQEDIGDKRKMAVTLMIHLTDVDWEGVKRAADAGVYGGAQYTEAAAWGFPDVLWNYEESEGNTRMRGLNIGRTPENGDVYINALQIFHVDGLSEEEKAAAIAEGKREIDTFLKWLQDNIEGFEQAKVKSYPSELYVRETRHINSMYRLTMADVWENANKSDAIAYGSYPVDVQAMHEKHYGNVISTPNQYAIPYRSILPLEIDNLLVTSKASGYDSLAAASARVIPTGMAVAEAGGFIATYAQDENIALKEIVGDAERIQEIQNMLVAQNMYLNPLENPEFAYNDSPIYADLKVLYSYGLLNGGYTNDFQLEEPMKTNQFVMLLENLAVRFTDFDTAAIEALSAKLQAQNEATTLITAADWIELLTILHATNVTADTFGESDAAIARKMVYPYLAEALRPYVAEYKINNEN